jgi:CMP/dCMP kinase
MIKICISGLTGSGKNTISDLLAKELNIPHIYKQMTKTYANIGKDPKLKATKDISALTLKGVAEDFDSEIVKMTEGKDCVVSTWLGPWMVKDATLRVWLTASKEERANRTFKREKKGKAEALKYLEEKDNITIKNFKKEYNIDITDHSIFEMVLNTERLNPQEIVSIISVALLSKEENRFK